MYKKETLKNGLRIITHNMKQRDSISIGFWVGVGGRYEEGNLKGGSHFLEHIVFKGSQKYTCEEIKDKVEGIGGTLNAFTSEEQTCFYAKIPSKHLKQTFDVLADMVFFPKISGRDMTKEKTVILEEIKMYRDLPQHLVMELLDELVWPNHPLGRNLAGTPQTVSAMRPSDLKKFHQAHYTPKNIVIAVAGNVEHSEIVNLAQKKLKNQISSEQQDYRKAGILQSKPQINLYKKNIEQMHMALGMPGFDENHKDRYVLSLLSIILGGNMSSRLFVEVREKRGLAYSISSCTKSLHDTGMFMIRAGVDNKKIFDTIKLIFKELSKIKRSCVSKKEFQLAKDYLFGQLMLGLEDTMEHMLWIGETIISRDKIKTLAHVIKEFNKITLQDIQRVAREVLDKNRFHLAIVGPLTEQQEHQINILFDTKS